MVVTTDEYGINHSVANAWRLVHNNTEVISIISGSENDKTSSKDNIEEFDTYDQVLNRINELNLDFQKYSFKET